MKILIDLVHLPNVNFFKFIIKLLQDAGHTVILTTQRRGRLPKVVAKEFPNMPFYNFGRHRGTFYSLLIEANFWRLIRMIGIIIKHRPDISLSVVSFPLEIGMWMFRKPNIQVSDDPERRFDMKIHKVFATRVFFPHIIKPHSIFETFYALKEWAYLSPDYFTPNKAALQKYNVTEKGYIFVREVSTGSINYMAQQEGSILSISKQLKGNFKVLLSLEDKQNRDLYPKDWHILEEPVEDIHSLLYYSKAVLSSGDSMAREGAMLGVPGVYCGVREMKANDILIEKNMLFKVPLHEVANFISGIDDGTVTVQDQTEFRTKLKNEWVDVNQFLIKILEEYKSR